jgi:hypothetical protein
MKSGLPGFCITGGKGFHVTFKNGYTVSVQFGPGNYCDNYDRRIGHEDAASAREGSSTAECAVWGSDGKMIEYGDWDSTVSNRSRPAEVLELLNWAASQPDFQAKTKGDDCG